MNDDLLWLLEAAILAPSGDNTQPWRFSLDDERLRIAFHVDESRDPSPMNAGQRMARIAVGAALENVVRTAERSGWSPQVEAPAPEALAAVTVTPTATREGDPTLRARVSNRGLYQGKALPEDQAARLKNQAINNSPVQRLWITDRGQLAQLARCIGQADARMFSAPHLRQAFLHNIRFDAPPNAAVEEGLSLGSLELRGGEGIGLRLLGWAPNWLVRLAAPMAFAAKAEALVASASGLCLGLVEGRDAQTDMHVGRAMQSDWLTLTTEGLATQPMMSIPVLDNALQWGGKAITKEVGADAARILMQEILKLSGAPQTARVAYILRFGTGSPVSGRTGRLPVARSLEPQKQNAVSKTTPDSMSRP